MFLFQSSTCRCCGATCERACSSSSRNSCDVTSPSNESCVLRTCRSSSTRNRFVAPPAHLNCFHSHQITRNVSSQTDNRRRQLCRLRRRSASQRTSDVRSADVIEFCAPQLRPAFFTHPTLLSRHACHCHSLCWRQRSAGARRFPRSLADGGDGISRRRWRHVTTCF